MSKSRDQIRSGIFATRKLATRVVDFFGEQIEIHQPKVGDIIKMRDASDDENGSVLIETLVKYSFVPGTNDRVFEDTDADAFKEMPFSKDFTRVLEAFGELTGIDFRSREATPEESAS